MRSYHTNRSTKHNEDNTGIGVEYEWNAKSAVGLGVYRNSLWQETHYLVYRYTPVRLGSWRGGVFGGLADGYRANNGGVAPAGGGIVTGEWGHLGLNFIAAPSDGAAVFAVQFKLGF